VISADLRGHTRVAGYAVIWKASGDLATAGQLELGPDSLRLRGGRQGSVRDIEVAYNEIVGLARATERVGRLRALRLESCDVGTILIAAFSGAALNNEILEQLQLALANIF
jgi:hypothetical protein